MGNRSLVVANAHERYGTVVRLAPDELSFSDPACVKQLYLSGSKFPKSRRYEGFSSTTRASFDMTDVHEHRVRRNLVRHVLAQSNIDEAEPIIADQVRKSLTWVKRSENSSLEIMLWMRRVMLDTAGSSTLLSNFSNEINQVSAGALFLGRSFHALDNEDPPTFLDDMDDFFNVTAIRWLAPWMLPVLNALPIPKIQHFLRAQQRGYQYGRQSFDEYIEQYGRYSGRIDLLTKMVGTKDSQPLTDEEISNELGSLLVGATDTTVVVSTWMLWELAQRPEWQQRIRTELRENKIVFKDGVPAFKDIKTLPVLDAFITECMRLHPAQSIGLPRVAGTDTASIGGIVLPKGVSFPPLPPPHSQIPRYLTNPDLRLNPIPQHPTQPIHFPHPTRLPP